MWLKIKIKMERKVPRFVSKTYFLMILNGRSPAVNSISSKIQHVVFHSKDINAVKYYWTSFMEKVQSRPRVGPSGGASPKRGQFNRCFSSLEFKIEAKPLKELDPEKIKNEIKRWVKAVVFYARQLSGSLHNVLVKAALLMGNRWSCEYCLAIWKGDELMNGKFFHNKLQTFRGTDCLPKS